MSVVYLSLGSNQYNRTDFIQKALDCLSCYEDIKIIKKSSLYETEPFGVKDQEWFINVVLEIFTDIPALRLLDICHEIEEKLGRNRNIERHWGERCIDIDILFYDNIVMNSETLTIPHKYIRERAFVLIPLTEIAPDYIHPVLGKTVLEMQKELNSTDKVFLYETRI